MKIISELLKDKWKPIVNHGLCDGKYLNQLKQIDKKKTDMIVNPITIKFDFNKEFVIETSDWEGAPCPICMILLNDYEWGKVAAKLKQTLETYYSSIWNDDDYEDFLWQQYENIVLSTHRVFYYEDMTNEEYNEYKKANEVKRKEIAKKVLKRLKNIS